MWPYAWAHIRLYPIHLAISHIVLVILEFCIQYIPHTLITFSFMHPSPLYTLRSAIFLSALRSKRIFRALWPYDRVVSCGCARNIIKSVSLSLSLSVFIYLHLLHLRARASTMGNVRPAALNISDADLTLSLFPPLLQVNQPNFTSNVTWFRASLPWTEPTPSFRRKHKNKPIVWLYYMY